MTPTADDEVLTEEQAHIARRRKRQRITRMITLLILVALIAALIAAVVFGFMAQGK